MSFSHLKQQILSCQLCQASLPNPANPIIQLHPQAKILIIGQAPGAKAHKLDTPFLDVSGKRLREWLGVDETQFYDETIFAIMPMGFCYPGKSSSGDLPPQERCAKEWHALIWPYLTQIELVLLVGQYAQQSYLSNWEQLNPTSQLQAQLKDYATAYPRLTQRVYHNHELPNHIMCLPHPSPRNQIWVKKNDWFEREQLPLLKARVKAVLTNN